MNKILDPNLKTERDNERQIMEIIEDRIKEEDRNIININNNSNPIFIEKIINNENNSSKKNAKTIKDEIDLKISDLKNLNMIILESFIKKKKTTKKKNSKKIVKENNNIEFDNQIITNHRLGEEAKTKEKDISDKKPDGDLTLNEIKLISSNCKSEEKITDNNLFAEDLKDNSNLNINSLLPSNNSLPNLNNKLNFDITCNSRNKNLIKIENKKTGDFTAMNSYLQSNLNNQNNNLNILNNNNNNNYLSNETDNEQILNNENTNNNFNMEAVKENEENEYNSKNLVLNAVINLNEIDSFAAKLDYNAINNNYSYSNKMGGMKSISDNIQGICFKNNESFEKQYLNSMENRRKKASGNNFEKINNRNLFENKTAIMSKNDISAINNVEKNYSSNDSIKANQKSNYYLNTEKNNYYESENLKDQSKLNKKEFSSSAKTKSKKTLKRISNDALALKQITSNNLTHRKSFLEDFEIKDNKSNVNFDNKNESNSLINCDEGIEINKSINSENEIINKKNFGMITKNEENSKNRINHFSENLSNVIDKIKKNNEFNEKKN